MIKSQSPGVFIQSCSKRRLVSRLREGEVIATAPKSKHEFVGPKKEPRICQYVPPLCGSTDNLLWLCCLLQRLNVVLNLGLSPPAVWASAAVGLIFGRCSRGQISVQVVGGALVPAARSGAAGEVDQKWRGDISGDAESLKWRPQFDPTERDGSWRGERGEEKLTHAARVWLLICKHVTCSSPDLPPSCVSPPLLPPSAGEVKLKDAMST